ncbi:hypothetical protein B0H19DRAFT_1275169 [Mycena capillaripes]|nr:hypothetical protein B0H19DRAFT_1275169 [Mycena capillaripes]
MQFRTTIVIAAALVFASAVQAVATPPTPELSCQLCGDGCCSASCAFQGLPDGGHCVGDVCHCTISSGAFRNDFEISSTARCLLQLIGHDDEVYSGDSSRDGLRGNSCFRKSRTHLGCLNRVEAPEHWDIIRSVKLSQDGLRAISSSEDYSVRILTLSKMGTSKILHFATGFLDTHRSPEVSQTEWFLAPNG